MDLWSVHVKYNNPAPIFTRNSFMEKPIFSNFVKISPFSMDDWGRVFEIRVSKGKCSNGYNTSFIVKAMGKKNSDNSSSSGNGDRSTPGGNGSKGNNPSDGNKSSNNPSQRPHHITQDWREFRASLFAREQEMDETGFTIRQIC